MQMQFQQEQLLHLQLLATRWILAYLHLHLHLHRHLHLHLHIQLQPQNKLQFVCNPKLNEAEGRCTSACEITIGKNRIEN